MGNSFFLAFLAILLFCCNSCSPNPELKLNQSIRKALKSNGDISAQEWKELIVIIDQEEQLSEYRDESRLKGYINQIAERLSRRSDSEIKLPVDITPDTIDKESVLIAGNKEAEYHFYYENSASTDGYINGDTEFKDAVYKLLSDIHQKMLSLKFNVINQKIHNLDTEIKEVNSLIDFLNPEKVRKYGNRANTEINEILKKIIDSTKKTDTSILVSDYIYSISTKDVNDELLKNKYSTKIALRDVVNKGYSILIVKLSSRFDGYYYDMKNKQVNINEKRPVYIWIIGSNEHLKSFVDDYRIEELKGYTNHVLFQNSDGLVNQPPFYTILPRTQRKGSFDRAERTSEVIHNIKNIRFDRNKQFQFAVAINLTSFPTGYDYFDVENYEISSSVNDEFSIADIIPITKIDRNDRRFIGSATHIMIVRSDQQSLVDQEIMVKYKVRLPKWVYDSSTLDDTSEELRDDKTFGFHYLVEGVAEAFNYRTDTYFINIPLTLKR